MAFLGSQLRVTADVSMSVIAASSCEAVHGNQMSIVADSRMWSSAAFPKWLLRGCYGA